LSFSPDGKFLASGSADTTVMVWDVQTIRPQNKKQHLTRKELDELWEDLAIEGGRAPRRASWKLVGGDEAVDAFFKEKLPTLMPHDQKQIVALVQQLDSEVFEKREAAS